MKHGSLFKVESNQTIVIHVEFNNAVCMHVNLVGSNSIEHRGLEDMMYSVFA